MYMCFDDWAMVTELCSISHCIEEMKQENAFTRVPDIVYTLQATRHCHLNLQLNFSLHCKHGKQAISIQIISHSDVSMQASVVYTTASECFLCQL